MKSAILTALFLAIVPAHGDDLTIGTATNSVTFLTCNLATIDAQNNVTIDWQCINTYAARYAGRNSDMTSTLAYVLKAVHNGEIVNK